MSGKKGGTVGTGKGLDDYKAIAGAVERSGGFRTGTGIPNPGRSINPSKLEGGAFRLWAAVCGSAAAGGGGLAAGIKGHERTARAVVRLLLLAHGTVGRSCNGRPFELPEAVLQAVEAFGPCELEDAAVAAGMPDLYGKA